MSDRNESGPGADAAARIFPHVGDVARLCRARDWSTTALGPVEHWPSSLRTMVGVVLSSPFPTVLRWGPQLVQIYNDAYAAVMGEKHPGGLGQPTSECWPELWDAYSPIYRRVMEQGESLAFENRGFPTPHPGKGDDAFFNLACTPVRVEDGSVGGVLVTAHETTTTVQAREAEREREQAREALRESQDLYSAIHKLAPFTIALLTFPEGVIVEVNDAYEKMFGYSREEAVGKTPVELGTSADLEARVRLYDEIARTGSAHDWELEIVRKNGEHRLGSFSFELITVGGKRYILGTAFDVTDRRRAEDAMREAKEAAERANQVKTQFLSTLSHELRTPLTAVIGLADLLAGDVVGSTNERQKAFLARIDASAWHLVSIIDEILTYSRTEAGKERVRITRTDVAEIARSVVAMLQDQARARGLQMTLRGATAPVLANTDGGKLRQILVNVVGNALHYTAAGEVDVVLEEGQDSFELRVRDTGPGIPHDRLDDIFEPFVQLDSSTTREHGGTGLGLTICRRLARLLGGDVTAASTPGAGSTFTVRLPRTSAPETMLAD